MGQQLVLGIQCDIRSRSVRGAIETVLAAIQRNRRDWARIRRRVRRFAYLNPSEEDDSTLGKWQVDEREASRLGPQSGKPYTWGRQEGSYSAPGDIFISRLARHLNQDLLVGLVAHECGHAATREAEFTKRNIGDQEWASELCADYHAFRWGFENQIRQLARSRRIGHHCVLPGETIVVGGTGGECLSWKVDRWFYLRPIKHG